MPRRRARRAALPGAEAGRQPLVRVPAALDIDTGRRHIIVGTMAIMALPSGWPRLGRGAVQLRGCACKLRSQAHSPEKGSLRNRACPLTSLTVCVGKQREAPRRLTTRREPALNSSSSHRSTRPSRSCCARHSAVLVLEMDGMPLVSTLAALPLTEKHQLTETGWRTCGTRNRYDSVPSAIAYAHKDQRCHSEITRMCTMQIFAVVRSSSGHICSLHPLHGHANVAAGIRDCSTEDA